MRTNRLISRRVRLGALAVAAAAGLAPAVRASLWENQSWALTGIVNTAVGYDSNLTLSRDGPEDTYVQASPQLTLVRRNSSTDLHFDGIVTGTEFLRGRQPGQIDLLGRAVYAYPIIEGRLPLYESSLTWLRNSEPNQYLGRRVRHERTSFTGEGHIGLTGKLGARGEIDAYSDDFKDPTLNQNSRWRAYVGLLYEKRPGLEASLNVGVARGRSEPNAGMQAEMKSNETYVTARVRGEITPKITGSFYAGLGEVDYRGGYENTQTLPVLGADLTWGLDPRRTLVLAAYSGADYSPDGQAIDTARAFLSFTHVIVGRWQYILRGGPTRTVFRREIRQSTDLAWEGGAEFNYIPSTRFRVGVGLSYTTQDSDARDREFDRSTASLNSSYRF